MRRRIVRSSSERVRVLPELPYRPREQRSQIQLLCPPPMLRYAYFVPAGILILACTWAGQTFGLWLAAHFVSSRGGIAIGGICGSLLFIGVAVAWLGSRFEKRLYKNFMAEIHARGLCPSCG